MAPISDLIAAMREVAPESRTHLDAQEVRQLRRLTRSLISAAPECSAEYSRYLTARERSLPVSMDSVGGWLTGKRILVTGGTGCIGSSLIRMLAELRPERLVSVSRGITRDWPQQPGAEYLHADVRDQAALLAIVGEIRPHVIFHVAAQRDPGLAERSVYRTVTTNVLGTLNIISAAEKHGIEEIVFASTGKTVIPYTPDIYASSKRVGEWLAANAAGRGNSACLAARFTHVVDNSIVHDRILAGCESGLIRLHDAHSAFYIQSALESAQLLICAGSEKRYGQLGVYAIRDLGWPVDLLSMALGALSHTGSESAIYFSGHDPGYRSNITFPGQYDPQSSWQFGPLINSFEAREAYGADYGCIDVFPRKPLLGTELEAQFIALREACASCAPAELIREELDKLTWLIFEKTLELVPAEVLLRIRNAEISHPSPEGSAHPRILAAIAGRAAAGPAD